MMSNVINKTFNLAVSSLTSEPDKMIDPVSFLRSISKVESDSFQICQFLELLKRKFSSLSAVQQHQYLSVIIYCAYLSSENNDIKRSISELGTEVLTFIEKSKTLSSKKIGYSTLTSLINYGNNDLIYLAVNTILKDATSRYTAIIIISINAICGFITTDLVPIFLPVIEQRLYHQDAAVRVQSVQALHCMYKVGSEFVKNTRKHIKIAITDSNPEVMAAALPYIHEVIKNEITNYKDLPPVLISILKQVVQGKLPLHMSLHGLSAPFVQILLLKLLQYFDINDDTKTSLADALLNMINYCQTCKHHIAFGVLSECISTAIHFYKEDEVIFNQAVHSLSTFVTSKDANLLSTGISLLTQIAKIKPSCCAQYQSIVLKCLSHSDSTIKKQTLVLLQALINEDNYKVICNHVISMMNSFDDPYFVKSFSENLSAIAEKFSSDSMWLLQILHTLIEKSGEHSSDMVCNRLIEQVSKVSTSNLSIELGYCLKLLRGQMSFHNFKVTLLIISKYLNEISDQIDKVVDTVLEHSENRLKSCKMNEAETLFIIISFAKQVLIHESSNLNIVQKITEMSCDCSISSPAVYQALNELNVMSNDKEIIKILSNSNFEFDEDFSFLEQYEDEDKEEIESDSVKNNPKEAGLKSQSYTFQTQSVIRTSTALTASMVSQPVPSVVGESFLSRKATTEGAVFWDKEGYQRPKSNLSLNQALKNLSTVGDTTEEDRAMLQIVNDVFRAADFNDKESS